MSRSGGYYNDSSATKSNKKQILPSKTFPNNFFFKAFAQNSKFTHSISPLLLAAGLEHLLPWPDQLGAGSWHPLPNVKCLCRLCTCYWSCKLASWSGGWLLWPEPSDGVVVCLTRISCIIIKNFSIGLELELQGIAMQRCRICIGIVFVFFKRQELVLEFYC